MADPGRSTQDLSRRDLLKSAAVGGLTVVAGSALSGCAAGGATTPEAAIDHQAAYPAWRQTLAGHRIAGVEARTVQNRWPRLVSRNARLGVHGWGGDDGILLVHTDKGASGWGFAPGVNADRASDYLNQYRGRPLTELFDPAVGRADGVPKHMDLALHDLAGVILGVPVFRMIGGDRPTKTPCYSGMIYFDDIEPLERHPGIEQVLFNAGADHQFGYRQMKIKVGRGNRWMDHDAGLQRDIDVTNALAEAYPDVTFLADANDGYSVEDVKKYLSGINTELLFMEESFRESIEGYTALRRFLNDRGMKTYIADGEADPDPALLERLMARDLLDVHLTDTYGLGFTEWRKLMPSLKARGVLTSPHTWGSRLKTVYTAHLASGLGNVLTIEGVTAFSKEIDYAAYNPDKNGMIAPPDLPGFGLTLR